RIAREPAKRDKLRLRADLYQQRSMAADLPGGPRWRARLVGERIQNEFRDALFGLQEVQCGDAVDHREAQRHSGRFRRTCQAPIVSLPPLSLQGQAGQALLALFAPTPAA